MNKIWPVALILGGVAIAAIIWFGMKSVNTKSDVELINEAILEMRDQEAQQREDAAMLMATVLPSPGSCAGVTTGIAFAICEGETEHGGPLPDWTAMTSSAEQACILDAFHQTNAHAFRIRGEDYDEAAPDDVRVKTFVADLCDAILWSDGIGWGDTDSPLTALIDAFYADRAESRVTPKRVY
jgi:hypothetical protein